MYRQFLALELAYRGHLREAYAVDRRSTLVDPKASRFTWHLDPFLVLSLLGAIPESLAATTFGHALESWKSVADVSLSRPARQLRGLPWWLARGDTASLARFALRAEQEARTQTSGRGKLRGRYLHAAATAYLALARARFGRGVASLSIHPGHALYRERLLLREAHRGPTAPSRGQAQQAGAVLDRWVWKAEGPLFVLGTLEQGRIAEGLGERQKAIDSYQFVARCLAACRPRAGTVCTRGSCGVGAAGGAVALTSGRRRLCPEDSRIRSAAPAEGSGGMSPNTEPTQT